MNAQDQRQESGNNSIQTTPKVFHDEVFGWSGLPQRPAQGASLFPIPERMRGFQAEHNSALKELRRKFILPPDPSVVTFLTEHRTLPQILLEAADHLRAYFGADTIFNLRAPIDESGSRTLYAVVMWPGTVSAVKAALARFDDEWWIAHSRQASGYLTFTYELV
ncbi:MAG TPA: hypothetical protein VKG25_13940 [Bryobacteraceae bacterium]|nr:hypothetical protein [Bryobacteraceae bacterium]